MPVKMDIPIIVLAAAYNAPRYVLAAGSALQAKRDLLYHAFRAGLSEAQTKEHLEQFDQLTRQVWDETCSLHKNISSMTAADQTKAFREVLEGKFLAFGFPNKFGSKVRPGDSYIEAVEKGFRHGWAEGDNMLHPLLNDLGDPQNITALTAPLTKARNSRAVVRIVFPG
ncbi:MAG: hypothetical protein AB7G06_05345 [Bdellovibrionales bacterium]